MPKESISVVTEEENIKKENNSKIKDLIMILGLVLAIVAAALFMIGFNPFKKDETPQVKVISSNRYATDENVSEKDKRTMAIVNDKFLPKDEIKSREKSKKEVVEDDTEKSKKEVVEDDTELSHGVRRISVASDSSLKEKIDDLEAKLSKKNIELKEFNEKLRVLSQKISSLEEKAITLKDEKQPIEKRETQESQAECVPSSSYARTYVKKGAWGFEKSKPVFLDGAKIKVEKFISVGGFDYFQHKGQYFKKSEFLCQ